MTWTILILVLGIALYLFGGMLFKQDGKKAPAIGVVIAKKAMKIVAIIVIAGSVTRLYTPYYLTSVNPLILQEMVQGMQAQKAEESSRQIRDYVSDNMDKLTENAPILGNADAKNTIFVFTDFSCPYCRRVHGEIERVLKERNDVRVVVKNFSIHGPLSDAPARAVIAAKAQGADKSAALVNMLMTREFYSQSDMKDQANLGAKVKANVLKMAKEAGLDVSKLEADMNGEAVSNELGQVRDLAGRFEIGGTPFLIINDKAFPGAIPYDQIITALK